jgi:hypothetical protein
MTGSMQCERGNFTAIVSATNCRSLTNPPDRLFRITFADRLAEGLGKVAAIAGLVMSDNLLSLSSRVIFSPNGRVP